MNASLFVNEIRIPLSSIEQLDIFQCLTTGLSSRHKREIESYLVNQGWISMFEGDVLFSIPKATSDFSQEQEAVKNGLGSLNIQNSSSQIIKVIKLRQAPQRVLERLTFVILSHQARTKGIFTTYGRHFFKPTSLVEKLSHRAVDLTLVVEDGYVKIYLSPSYAALLNIEDTYREKLPGIELIALCKYRNKANCQLALDDGSCPFITPGTLGYYDQAIAIDSLEDSEKMLLRNRFNGCPKIGEVSKVILAKSTKKAKKYSVYPPYVVFIGISREDLYSKPERLRQYRDATLMLPGKRWQETVRWLRDIFSITSEELLQNLDLHIGDFKIPVQIILPIEIKGSLNQAIEYRTIMFPDQQIVINENNPAAQSYGGGWLFSNKGAYDRESINRPFDSIKPFLVVPDDPEITELSRRLMDIFSDGLYKSRAERGDQDFYGLNRPESKSKYNMKFSNPWKEEEGLYLIPNIEDITYKNIVQDIKREWNLSQQKDMNRIAIIITPTSKLEDNELYYKLKKTFVEEGIPSQFVSFNTLKKLGDTKSPFGPTLNSLWLNIYAKMGGSLGGWQVKWKMCIALLELDLE